jgi:hypothetical protein
MEDNQVEVEITVPLSATMLKWVPSIKLKVGAMVKKKDTLGFYSLKTNTPPSLKVVAPISGKVAWTGKPIDMEIDREKEEDRVSSLMVCRIEPCAHRIVYNGTCTDCFEPCREHEKFKISEKIANVTTDTSYVHESIESILNSKKLVMLLDIDNTILHALKASHQMIEKFLETEEKKDEYFILSYDELNGFIVKVRPFLMDFLAKSSEIFEIIVYTFGSRSYATSVLAQIDPEEKYLKVYSLGFANDNTRRIFQRHQRSRQDFAEEVCRHSRYHRRPCHCLGILLHTFGRYFAFLFFQGRTHRQAHKGQKRKRRPIATRSTYTKAFFIRLFFKVPAGIPPQNPQGLFFGGIDFNPKGGLIRLLKS